MATQLQRRRGTTVQHSTFTGAQGELTVDTTKNTVVVHDGSTAGGHPLLKEAAIGSTVQAYDADLSTWAGVTPGTGVATALAVNVGSSGAFVTNGGALGTPSSGTLTNATGLPVAAIVGDTSTAVGVGSIELGHASDTTISRTGAGAIAVEGVGVALNSTSLTHTASTIELGHASDTTIARASAGVISVEGNTVAMLATTQTFTAPQRGTQTTDNDLSMDLSVTNFWSCTPTAGGALTFTNIPTGQGGIIKFVNGSNYAITAAATTKVTSTFLATISATGTYIIHYYCDGTNVYCSTAGAMA